MDEVEQNEKTIVIASDHAGFTIKQVIVRYLKEKQYQYEDLGPFSDAAVNWAEYGARAAGRVSRQPDTTRGILICGTGLGMSIVANKFRRVRAAVCNDEYSASMSRKHNNANILTLGARVIDSRTALSIVELWLNTDFEAGRHQERLNFISDTVEPDNFK